MNKQEIEKAIYVMKNIKHLLVDVIGNKNNEKELDMAISALEQQLNGGWIPVTERLPEENGHYNSLTAGFTVIDNTTGEYPDTEKIALTEDWANKLIYCDIYGFALLEDGHMLLVDDCGNAVHCPPDRFKVIPIQSTIDLEKR